jgi:hypothetical protein
VIGAVLSVLQAGATSLAVLAGLFRWLLIAVVVIALVFGVLWLIGAQIAQVGEHDARMTEQPFDDGRDW